MLRIYKKNNIITESALRAMNEGQEIYLYGCGDIGKVIAGVFIEQGIRIDGFVVDKAFYKAGEEVNDIPIFCIDDVLNSIQKKLIIVTHRGCKIEKLQSYQNIQVINEDIFSYFSVEPNNEYIDFYFYSRNKEKFEDLYDLLHDEKSRRTLEAFMNQKISGELQYLKEVYEDNQYYDSEIIDFSKLKVIVDCGAYNGDSYISFLENYKGVRGKEYDGIAYLLEPNKINCNLLIETCGEDKRCRIKELGAWDKKDILKFSEEGTSSVIMEKGMVTIPVDKIDNVIEDRVDFIKMDIEGAEYKALLGAAESIKRWHPVLAICVYHKKDDLLEIPYLIKSICPEYQFYLRAYSRYSQELVLYAIFDS